MADGASLDPARLRTEALAARELAKKERQAKQRAEAKGKRARMAAHVEGKFEQYVERVARAVENAAHAGKLEASVRVEGFATYELEKERGQALRPVWDAVVDHFKAQGFKARVRIVGSTEWFHGEPGPGPDEVLIEVAWDE